MIYFHENAGNIGNRLWSIENLYKSVKVNVLIVGYRGYGHSTGTPNEEGVQEDARNIFKFAQNYPGIDPNRLYIFGSSLGGAVSVYLLHHLCVVERKQYPVKGLIL